MNTRYSVYEINHVKKLKAMVALFASMFIISSTLGIFLWNKEHSAHAPIRQELSNIRALNTRMTGTVESLQGYKDAREGEIQKIQRYILKVNANILPKNALEIAHYESVNSEAVGVPLSLGVAITKVESTFNANATSHTGPVGLKQIAIVHWKDYFNADDNSFKRVDKNIEYGYHILKKHYVESGSYFVALKKYYGGTEQENVAYAQKVMYTSKQIEQILGG